MAKTSRKQPAARRRASGRPKSGPRRPDAAKPRARAAAKRSKRAPARKRASLTRRKASTARPPAKHKGPALNASRASKTKNASKIKKLKSAAPAAPRDMKPTKPRPAVATAQVSKPGARPAASDRHRVSHPTTLDRARRSLPESDRLGTADEADARLISAARTGHDELVTALKRHTEASPALTAGDVDAKWEDAYALGDEAPGGDNPTPGQDRVDDIGKALGVVYQDNEELLGSEKIEERDRHRWEFDPASSDDWPHDKDR